MTMTGAASLSSRNRRKRSIPLSSGILTSVMMQPVWTVGAAPGRGPQREAKDRSPHGIGLHHDLAAVGFDNGAADRQTDTHAVALVGDKGLEQLRHQLRRDSGPGIGHADEDHIVVAGCRGNNELASLRRLHGLDSISQQIQQHLLNLHLVDKDEIDGRVELKPETHTLILGSNQRQGAGLLNELLDAFHLTVAVAPSDEFAQATDDLSRAQSLIAGLVHGIAQQARAVLHTTFEQASRALHVAHNGQ